MTDDPRTSADSRSSRAAVREGALAGGRRRITRRLLTAITAAGLGVDAYVHWSLAANFDSLTGTGSLQISQGQLFRLEAILALVALVLLLATRHRLAAVFALMLAAGGAGAVLFFAYVDVGSLGPLPDMYDPGWYTEKTVSAVAEGMAALAALCLLLLPAADRERPEPPT